MKITIEIPEEEIKEDVKRIIAAEIAKSAYASYQSRELRKMYRDIIKELIYEPKLKAEIINSTVNQAAREIRNRSVPVLTQKLIDTLKKEN